MGIQREVVVKVEPPWVWATWEWKVRVELKDGSYGEFVLNWNEYNSVEWSCKMKVVITISLLRATPGPSFCSELYPVIRVRQRVLEVIILLGPNGKI